MTGNKWSYHYSGGRKDLQAGSRAGSDFAARQVRLGKPDLQEGFQFFVAQLADEVAADLCRLAVTDMHADHGSQND
jgi:hypothetical protein